MSRVGSEATGNAWTHRMRSYTSAAVVNETSDADPFGVSDANRSGWASSNLVKAPSPEPAVAGGGSGYDDDA